MRIQATGSVTLRSFEEPYEGLLPLALRIGKVAGYVSQGSVIDSLLSDAATRERLGKPDRWLVVRTGSGAVGMAAAAWFKEYADKPPVLPIGPGSKAGVHINKANTDYHAGLMIASGMRFACVNVMDIAGQNLVIHAMRQLPNLRCVVYFERVNEHGYLQAATGAEAADKWWNRFAPVLWNFKEHWHRLYVQCFNEPPPTQDYAAYMNDFYARMAQLAPAGLQFAMYTYSVGNPDWSLWNTLLPSLRIGYEKGWALDLHEYGGRSAFDDGLMLPGLWGWYTMRYRRVYSDYLQPAGLGDMPLVITESGLDYRYAAGGNTEPGTGPYTVVLGGNGRRYVDEVIAPLDAEYKKDRFVKGFAVFLHGAVKPEQWQAYELEPIKDTFYGYVAQANKE